MQGADAFWLQRLALRVEHYALSFLTKARN